MAVTTLSSREFNQDTSRAKRLPSEGRCSSPTGAVRRTAEHRGVPKAVLPLQNAG